MVEFKHWRSALEIAADPGGAEQARVQGEMRANQVRGACGLVGLWACVVCAACGMGGAEQARVQGQMRADQVWG